MAEVRALAVRAFEACRCEAMARVDFFLRADGVVPRQRAQHDPRLHARSRCTRKLWEATGVPYSELLDRLIDLALARHARRTHRAGKQR